METADDITHNIVYRRREREPYIASQDTHQC